MKRLYTTLITMAAMLMPAAAQQEQPSALRYRVGICDWMVLKRQKPGVLTLASELGADGVELDMGPLGQRDAFDNQLRQAEAAQRFRHTADSLGVAIGAMAMSGFYGQDLTQKPTYMALANDCFDTMDRLGIGSGVAFLPLGGCGNGWLADKQKRALVVSRLREIGQAAHRRGKRVGIDTPLDARGNLRLLSEIGSPGIAIFYKVQTAVEQGLDISAELRRLGARNICAIHASGPDGRWLSRDTAIDMPALRQTLDQMGWSGWLFVERSRDTTMVRNVKMNYGANVRYLKEIFNHYPTPHVALDSAGRPRDYVETIISRARKATDELSITWTPRGQEVANIIANRYFALNDIYARRDSMRQTDPQLADAQCDASLYRTHTAFLTDLSLHLKPQETDRVKDVMTYNVVSVTYKAHLDMIPTLQDEEKQQIMAWLLEARELAIDAESSKKKHEIFGRYKGRINNYLTRRGYDLTREREAWYERMRQAEAATDHSSAAPATGGMTATSHSPQAMMTSTPLGAVRWTGGFWGDRFSLLADTTVWDMWDTWQNADVSHGFRNFQVAAGTVGGVHHGPPFHDGDMYKWLEACAAVYAVTRDTRLDSLMDLFISQVRLAQRADGYIHTPVIISERNAGIDSHAADSTVTGLQKADNQKQAFASRLNFETYNLGHLMTAAVIHHRATGKTTLLDCGRRAADFLCHFLSSDAAGLSRNAICPSHYMGATEMYRETGDERYLTLARGLIAIRDSVKAGEDHNQDRHPLRQQYEAMGHAVRANYLYAGVADLYAETGESQLMRNLTAIWDDIVSHKIYIMGGCGALYDGVSPDGTTYNQPSIQQIHQAYGRQFQLPQETAHNEICAQIGMLLFSWRMFQVTGDDKYLDNIETELYNGILSGISLNGRDYFYTEALRRTANFPYTMRWPKHRQHYISCFCCPPNTVRTLCEAQNYAYTTSTDGTTLNVCLYGQNSLTTGDLEVEQTTDYPWDGRVRLTIRKAGRLSTLKLHIPAWCDSYTVSVNGQRADTPTLTRQWRDGDVVELNMAMRPRLMEANPLVEEARNQVAVQRGPIVYCLERQDVADSCRLGDIALPADISLQPVKTTIGGHTLTALEGDALLTNSRAWDNQTLYREMRPADTSRKVRIRLIPYYAWDNRGIQDMSLWLPVVH